MNIRSSVAAAVGAATFFAANYANAAGVTSGTGGFFHVENVTIQAGCSVTAFTSDLTSGSDTIMHVQDGNGNYVAGDDDSAGNFASRVTFTRSSTASLTFIVRAYNSATEGTGRLHVHQAGAGCPSELNIPIAFGAGFLQAVPYAAVGTRFRTVQPPSGLADTVMLYMKSDYTRVDKYDDDSGVLNTSFLEVTAANAGTATAYVLVGGFRSSGATRLVRDDDAGSTDYDVDGLGASLEAAIGSNAYNNDSDGDGISDSLELYGVDSTIARYPFFGGSPTQRDAYVEVDWKRCIPGGSDPEEVSCVPAGGSAADPDRLRWRPDQVAVVQAKYSDIGINVHLDIGVETPAGEPAPTYGNWGGATRAADTSPPHANVACTYVTANRNGFREWFVAGGAGGKSEYRTRCSSGGQDPSANAHELGHALGRAHEGDLGSPSMGYNCKPNYPSLMNYAYDNGRGLADRPNGRFSKGDKMLGANGLPFPLNPGSVIESDGLGPFTTEKQALLATYGIQLSLTAAGVDWNRDGQISSTPIRAPINWSWTCGVGEFATSGRDKDAAIDETTHAAMAWRPSDFWQTDQLFWITRRASDNRLTYRTALQPISGCATTTAGCRMPWSPNFYSSAPYVLPAGMVTDLAPAAVGYNSPGDSRGELVVFAAVGTGTSKTLKYAVYDGNGWSTIQSLPVDATLTGPPSAVLSEGHLYVFAPNSGRMRQWRYNIAGNYWDGPLEQVSTNWTFLQPSNLGGAVAVGFFKQNGTPIERRVLVYLDASDNLLRFARFDGGLWDVTVMPRLSESQPSVAYVPFALSAIEPQDGRFYISTTSSVGGGAFAGFVSFTEGNDISAGAATRRLLLTQEGRLDGPWTTVRGAVPLLYNRSIDRNLRAAWTSGSSHFSPFADDSPNLTITDSDDRPVIYAKMSCSLLGGCP